MRKTETWELTISYWPNATENNVKPVHSRAFVEEDDYPGYYRPTSFDFSSPPSRQDFADLVAIIPYLHGQDFLLVLATNDWPMLSYGMKAASTELQDAQGRIIGKVEVCKQPLYHGGSYSPIGVDMATRDGIVNRLPKDKREDAKRLIRNRENYILEQVTTNGSLEQENVAYVIRCLLNEAGLLKTKPRKQLQRKLDRCKP